MAREIEIEMTNRDLLREAQRIYRRPRNRRTLKQIYALLIVRGWARANNYRYTTRRRGDNIYVTLTEKHPVASIE